MDNVYTFNIIIAHDEDAWRISIPALEIEGTGYQDYNRSIEFARDMIAEYLMSLPTSEIVEKAFENNNITSDLQGAIPIEIDLDSYKKESRAKSERNYDQSLDANLNKEDSNLISTQITELKNKATSHIEDYVNRIPNKKAIIAAILAIIICATGVSVSNSIKDYRQSKYIEQTMQSSRENIKNGNYDDACDELTKLFGAKGTDSHKKEIDSLYNYSYMKNERQKSSPVGITKQYDCSKKIAFDSDDEFYKDAEKLKTEIKEEYDADQKEKQAARQKADEEKREREKQAAIEAEKQEAKKMRDYYEKLATTIPFEGMELKYIDCTACGAHDYEETSISGGDKYDMAYYWQTEKAGWFRVYSKDDIIVKTETLKFLDNCWKDDGLPNVDEIRSLKKPIIDEYGSTRDIEVDEYWTGKEYADTKYKEYKKEMKKSDAYNEYSEDELDNIAWIKAFNHWLENHNPRFYDARG